MNPPVSGTPLRGVVMTLAALLSLFIMDESASASICWSGERDVVLGLGPGMNIIYFDLNGDGTDDFGFRSYEGTLSLAPLGGNKGVADPTWQLGHLNYRPLSAGALVDATLPGAYL